MACVALTGRHSSQSFSAIRGPTARVEDDIRAGEDNICGQRQHHAAGPGTARQAADHQLPGAEHLFADVVDRLDIGPGLQPRRLGSLDHVEVHAIGETAAPTLDQQHLGISGLGPAQSGDQSLALLGAHGAVIKLEGELADSPRFTVADRLIGFGVRGRGDRSVEDGHVIQLSSEYMPGWTFEGFFARPGFASHRTDPHTVIAGGDQYRVVAHRQNVSRCAAA
jgi:hypothetical protein